MEENELIEVLQSYKDAIQLLEEKLNAFSEEMNHVREEMQTKLDSLENTVIHEILEPAVEASNKAAYDRELEDYKGRYSEKVSPYLDRIKAVEDEDFDFWKNTYDGWKDYEADKGESALNEEQYLDSVLNKVKNQLEAIKDAMDASEIEMKVDGDGNAQLDVDGETVATEEASEEPKEDFEENLGEAGELSDEEMAKLEEEKKSEGLI